MEGLLGEKGDPGVGVRDEAKAKADPDSQRNQYQCGTVPGTGRCLGIFGPETDEFPVAGVGGPK